MVRKLICLSVAMTCLSGSTALAQNGVIVDPDSPAGKEYAIPTDRAKHDAGLPPGSGTSSGGSGGGATTTDTGSTELFGAGITPEKGNKPAGHSGSGNGSKTDRPQGNGSGGQQSSRVTDGAPAAFSAPDPSSGALPWLLGIGGMVLLVALGGGMLARRGGRLST